MEVPISNPLALDLHILGLELVYEHSSGTQSSGEDAVEVRQLVQGSNPPQVFAAAFLAFFPSFAPLFFAVSCLPFFSSQCSDVSFCRTPFTCV